MSIPLMSVMVVAIIMMSMKINMIMGLGRSRIPAIASRAVNTKVITITMVAAHHPTR